MTWTSGHGEVMSRGRAEEAGAAGRGRAQHGRLGRGQPRQQFRRTRCPAIAVLDAPLHDQPPEEVGLRERQRPTRIYPRSRRRWSASAPCRRRSWCCRTSRRTSPRSRFTRSRAAGPGSSTRCSSDGGCCFATRCPTWCCPAALFRSEHGLVDRRDGTEMARLVGDELRRGRHSRRRPSPDARPAPCAGDRAAHAARALAPRCPARWAARAATSSSSTIAAPMPPPAHIETTPSVAPRRRSSPSIVTTMRAPVAAIGWPRLAPLPLTLTIVLGRGRACARRRPAPSRTPR